MAGRSRRGQPLLLRTVRADDITGSLAPGERICAAASQGEHVALGTDRGATLVLDVDGHVLFRILPAPVVGQINTVSAVTALAFLPVNQNGIVVADNGGSLSLVSLSTLLHSPLARPVTKSRASARPFVTSLALSPDFDAKTESGSLYYGTSTGTLVRRTKGTVFASADNTIFNGGPDPVENLIYFAPYIIFSFRDAVHVLHYHSGASLATFSHALSTSSVFSMCVASHDLFISYGRKVVRISPPRHDSESFRSTDAIRFPTNILAIRPLSDHVITTVHADGTVCALSIVDTISVIGSSPLPMDADGSLPVSVVGAGPVAGGRYVQIAFPRGIVALRRVRASERVEYLVSRGMYSQAMAHCQRFKQAEALLEVADEYASYLWEKEKRYTDAMHIWAEYILPSAGVDYWRALADRMKKCGRLDVLEPYFPLNDRNVLSSDIYVAALEGHLQSKDYDGFYRCIVRWPVLYPVETVFSLCESALSSLLLASSDESTDDALRTVLRAVHKLRDYQNRSLDALLVLADVSESEALQYCTAQQLWPRLFSYPRGPVEERTARGLVEDIAEPLTSRVRRFVSRERSLDSLVEVQRLLLRLTEANAAAVVRAIEGVVAQVGIEAVLQVVKPLPDLYIPLLVDIVHNQADRVEAAVLARVGEALSQQFENDDPAVKIGLQRALALARQES